MVFFKIFWNVLFLFTGISLIARESDTLIKNRSIGIHYGNMGIKEQNLHSKVHRGFVIGLTYYHNFGLKQNSGFSIDLGFSQPRTSLEEFSESNFANVRLNYFHLFPILGRGRFEFNSGPSFQLNYDAAHFDNWDESHLYWANHLSLNLNNKLAYHLSSSRTLFLNVNISIFSLTSRPEKDRMFKIDDFSFKGIINNLHSNLELTSLNRFLFLLFQAEYPIRIHSSFTLAGNYTFSYIDQKRININTYQNIRHQIGLKFIF